MSIPSASLRPYVRQAGEHQRLAYTGGHELAVILDAAVTGGQLTVIDTHTRRGDASPVHVHSRDDEAFLLLDGQMTVWVGEERHQLRPGGIAFLPRDIPHAVRYDIASRALVLSTPAGFQEGVFRTAGWDLSLPGPKAGSPPRMRSAGPLSRPGSQSSGHPTGSAINPPSLPVAGRVQCPTPATGRPGPGTGCGYRVPAHADPPRRAAAGVGRADV